MNGLDRENQKTKPKILFATDISGLGGGETSLLNLLLALKEIGFQLVLVCPPGQLYDRASQSEITTIGLKLPRVSMILGFMPLFSVLTILKLFFMIKKNRIDIVHVESLLAFYYFGTAAWLAKIPCVATYHGYWQLKSRLARTIISHFCQRLYPVSKTTALDIYDTGLISADKIRIIPLSLNSQFLGDLPTKRESRLSFGLPLEIPIVMQVARFQPVKGQMVLLEALAQLVRLQDGPIPFVVFVGDLLDTTHDDAIIYKESVKERAQKGDLRKHVCFLGWQQRIPELMHAADIVVTPSDYETFSMATIEAMAVGTLVIATSSGGPAEIIGDQGIGILIPPKAPDILAEAIRSALSDRSESERIAFKAKEFVTANYSPKTRCDALVKEYMEIMQCKAGKQGGL